MKKTVETAQKQGNILGINVISTSMSSVLTRVKKYLTHNVHFYIVTPNPELILMAQNNPDLKRALNSSEFPVPDGVGLNFASKFIDKEPLNIIPGRKLFIELIKMADENGWKIFLLGGESGEAGVAADKLKEKYKKVIIDSFGGPKLSKSAEPIGEIGERLEKEAAQRINRFVPDLLFVAFSNPKQEIWIYKNIGKLRVGGAMAVGGTFRYIAGMSSLPPSFMEKAGLEWLWRLITEPRRVVRVFKAVVIFPIKVLRYKPRTR
ncbi:MAG TPA: WecB/TagA/CpsF family glycosyltransferase [Patescibacteria group bacterium]|nr:WecB/TagA/CpsF family glycosyltransferase [Patescibacteria group bacterium]